MSRKLNEQFLNVFLEIDKLCCEKFGINVGGVTEYISRLNNARFAPGRDDVLPRLVRYRNLRNRFAHEPGAIRKSDDVVKDDVRWLHRFLADLRRRKDPIAKYLKKARRYAIRRKLRKIFGVAMVVLVVALACIIWYLLSKG